MDTLAPTPERVRHAGPDGIVEVDTAQAGVHAARVRDILERYWRRGELARDKGENSRRYMAGTRLREAYDRSGRDSLPVVGMLAVDGSRDPERRMAGVIDAGAEYRRLLKHVGWLNVGAVVDCCCLGLALGPGASMERLRDGLARLADRLRIP